MSFYVCHLCASIEEFDINPLRIDNGGLEYMCTCFCVFSDILAIFINQSGRILFQIKAEYSSY